MWPSHPVFFQIRSKIQIYCLKELRYVNRGMASLECSAIKKNQWTNFCFKALLHLCMRITLNIIQSGEIGSCIEMYQALYKMFSHNVDRFFSQLKNSSREQEEWRWNVCLTWMWSGERAIFGLCHSKTKEDQNACHNPPIESLHTGKC